MRESEHPRLPTVTGFIQMSVREHGTKGASLLHSPPPVPPFLQDVPLTLTSLLST